MKTKTYNREDLENILEQMTDYIEDTSEDMLDTYFTDLAKTQLFNDAIGEIINIQNQENKTFITVLDEY